MMEATRPLALPRRWNAFASLLALLFCASSLTTLTRANSIWKRGQQSRAVSHSLQECLLNAGLETISTNLSDSHIYYEASMSDNTVFHYNPTAIVYARVTSDVQNAVKCASRFGNIAVAARSGGHSFGGYGSGGMDGSLIVDLAHMNRTFSDPAKGTAEVQPGARLGDVVKDLWSQQDGKRAISHGSCPGVGVGGHSLCGGFGPTSRAWGMTIDHIIEADVVLADGSVVTASERENQDLLWALKGSGSFFGIVTRFLFQTHDASAPSTFFAYRWVPSLKGADTLLDIMMVIQSFAQSPSLEDKFGFHIQLYLPRSGDSESYEMKPVAMHMRGSYLGPKADLQAKMQLLWDQLRNKRAPMPDAREEREEIYLDLMKDWDDFGQGKDKLNTQTLRKLHENFIAKTSLTRGHSKGFTRESLRDFFTMLWTTGYKAGSDEKKADGKSAWWVWNVYFELFGGANVAHRTQSHVEGSSFPYRDALWLIQLSTGTKWDQTLTKSAHRYLNKMDRKIQEAIKASGMGRASYSCYVDPDLPEKEWRDLYYGPSLRKLEEIKMKLDPNNLFRNPQSLGDKLKIQARWDGAVENQQNGLDWEGNDNVHPSPREVDE